MSGKDNWGRGVQSSLYSITWMQMQVKIKKTKLLLILCIHCNARTFGILTSKVGHTDLVFGTRSGFTVHCMQDYKSLYAAVTLCSTQVNIQTDIQTQTHTQRQHFDQLIWKAQPTGLIERGLQKWTLGNWGWPNRSGTLGYGPDTPRLFITRWHGNWE